MAKQKILLITPFYYPNIGGAESFALDLVKELETKYKVDICTINWGKQKTFKGVGIKNFIDIFPKLFFKSFGMCWKNRYSKIYALGLNSAFICSVLKLFFKVRVYTVLLALYDFKGCSALLRSISGICLKLSNRVFVEGKTGVQDLKCFNLKNVVIFQHWCNQNIFKPNESKRSDKLRVLFIGRPIPEKGKHIIQAVEYKLKDEEVEFIYVEKVEFKELPQYYQMADVVVVPSIYLEGFPRVVIESASCGCALIVSNKGSLPELCKDFAKIVEPTPDRFESVIMSFIENKKRLKNSQERAYFYALNHFSKKNVEVFL